MTHPISAPSGSPRTRGAVASSHRAPRQIARLNPAGFPARSSKPTRDEGWSPTSRETGKGGRVGQGWTSARRVSITDIIPIDGAAIRSHLRALVTAGMNTNFLAAYLTLTPAEVTALLHGGAETTTVQTAAAIMQIGFRPAPGRVYTPSVGAWRRMRALNAMGYSDERIDRMIADERSRPAVTTVASTMPTAVMIPTALWKAVERVYDRCAMDLGPDVEVRVRSRAEGMVPPLGWDDDDIDDPRARRQDKVTAKTGVDPVAILRRMHGDSVPLRRAEIRAVVAKALTEGWEIARLSRVLGITADSAIHALSKLRREIRTCETESIPAATCPDTGDVEDTAAVAAVAGADRGSGVGGESVLVDPAGIPGGRCCGPRAPSETESGSEQKDSSSRLENDDVCARTVRRCSGSVVPAGGCLRPEARVRRSRSRLRPRARAVAVAGRSPRFRLGADRAPPL